MRRKFYHLTLHLIPRLRMGRARIANSVGRSIVTFEHLLVSMVEIAMSAFRPLHRVLHPFARFEDYAFSLRLLIRESSCSLFKPFCYGYWRIGSVIAVIARWMTIPFRLVWRRWGEMTFEPVASTRAVTSRIQNSRLPALMLYPLEWLVGRIKQSATQFIHIGLFRYSAFMLDRSVALLVVAPLRLTGRCWNSAARRLFAISFHARRTFTIQKPSQSDRSSIMR